MPVSPIEDSFEECVILSRTVSQTRCERRCLLFRKVTELDSLANVERRCTGLAYEIRRTCYAEQAKRYAIHLIIFVTKVVAFSNSGKELVCRKAQARHRINLIYEDCETTAAQGQHNFADRAYPA